MLTENVSMDILLCNSVMCGQSIAKTCGIENSTRSDDMSLGKSRDLCENVCHNINRIADHYVERIGSSRNDLRSDALKNVNVGLCELDSRLTGLARDSGSDDDYIGTLSILVISCNNRDRVTEASTLDDIDNLSLNLGLVDIDENDLRCESL